MKTEITLIRGKRKLLYDSLTNTVTYFTKNGVLITAEHPKDWGLTRVFQFMESLLDAELI